MSTNLTIKGTSPNWKTNSHNHKNNLSIPMPRLNFNTALGCLKILRRNIINNPKKIICWWKFWEKNKLITLKLAIKYTNNFFNKIWRKASNSFWPRGSTSIQTGILPTTRNRNSTMSKIEYKYAKKRKRCLTRPSISNSKKPKAFEWCLKSYKGRKIGSPTPAKEWPKVEPLLYLIFIEYYCPYNHLPLPFVKTSYAIPFDIIILMHRFNV